MTISSDPGLSATSRPDRSALGRLTDQFHRSPDSAAVTDESGTWTYDELWSAARVAARALLVRGAGAGSTVGVCLPRSKEAVAAMLGIWQTGAVYVPLDPDYPVARIDDMCDRASIDLLVGQAALLSGLSTEVPRIDATDMVPDGPTSGGGPQRDSEPDPDSIAYILFTSGSSGAPKAVQVPHRGLSSVLSWITSTFSPDELAVGATSTSFSFDPSFIDVLGPLVSGGRVQIIPSALALSDADRSVTVLTSTPSVVSELSRAGRVPSALRLLLVGGETFPPSLAEDLLSGTPGLRLFNCYGPTEGTVLATFHEITLPVPDPIPIGRDLPGAGVVLLDEELSPVAPGEFGEICISGPQVADGYRGDPQGTAEHFVDWIDERGAPVRIYRTGDSGRRTADGSIEFGGRRDRQFKLRGFRIESGEIEVALSRHPRVAQAFVATAGSEPQLIAYVTASAPGLDVPDLRSWLQERLPSFMVPAHFVVLDSFPTSVNGKIAEDALPAWQPMNGPRRPATADDPSDHLTVGESIVAELTRRILHFEGPIRAEDDVLDDLGASSLSLFRLLSAMEDECSCRISLGRILGDTSIAGLARLLGTETEAPSHLSVNRNGTKVPLYLIHAYLGTALRYRRLGPYLSGDRPLIGVQVQEFGSRTRPTKTSVDQMAEEAVAQIRSLQPSGPYLLGGHSAGGLVAYEAARQLTGDGEQVPLVAVLDSPALRSPMQYFWSEAVLNWPDIASASGRQRVDQFRSLVERRRSVIRPRAGSDRVDTAITRSHRASNLAVKRYKPGPYGGAVAVLRTRQGVLMALGRNDLGWGKFTTGPVEEVVLPGLHNTIFEQPYVEVVGRQLDRLLEETEVARPHGHPGD
jgi:amino acid adenylation domain-containing protein